MNADYSLIGRQIALHRRRSRITQEQLAELCNISVSHINRIENGRKKPSLDVLITIADVLGTTMDHLLSGNQRNDYFTCFDEITELLTDCTSIERRLLCNILSAVKEFLHNTENTRNMLQ